MPNRLLRDWTDSDKINSLSVHAERFFTRLIMKVDDYGCFYADCRLLKANLFPLLLDAIREADMLRWMAECQKAGLIVLYESNNKEYLQILDFGQRLRSKTSKFPLPNIDESIHEEMIGDGYVYVIGVDINSSNLKIGYSLNPWARSKEISTGNHEKLSVLMKFKGSKSNESEFHKILKHQSTDREWFNLSIGIKKLLLDCDKIDLNACETLSKLRSYPFLLRSREVEVEEKLEVEVEEKGSDPQTNLSNEIFSSTKNKKKEKEHSPGPENWNTRPGIDEMDLELPDIKTGSIVELFRITKNIDVTDSQVLGLWSIFKSQNFGGEKFYQSKNEVYKHFMNWCKTQTIKNGNDHKTTGTDYSKFGKSAGAIRAGHDLAKELGIKL